MTKSADTHSRAFIQLLEPSGHRRASPEYDPWVTGLGVPELLGLYRDMRLVRRIDDEATALQRQGELALWPPLRGQEAAQLGSAGALAPGDFVFGSYREHGVAYARGVAPLDLIRVWRGTTASGWDPYAVGMAPAQVIIGAQTLHATGWAMGALLDGSPDVAIAYFGDGAMSEGDVAEAMVYAASFAAPVVFFCQNNHWAISEPVRLQSRTVLADRALGFGMPGVRVDGNDVIAVHAVTRAALDRARRGEGPTLIEAVTYRMGPHTTADDPTRYRPADELEAWAARDPIDRLAAHLRAAGALDDAEERRVSADADEAATELRAGCVALPDPDPMSIFDHVYAEPHAGISAARVAYADYLEGFEG